MGIGQKRSLLLVLALAACGDEEGPGGIVEPTPAVSVSVSTNWVSAPTIGTDDELYQYIRCDVSLRAEAAGAGQATWGDATIYWSAGVDRTVPLDSTPISAAEVRASWGGNTITADNTQEARWQFWAYAPFTNRVAFRYQRGAEGETRTASVDFTCGPAVPPGGTAPPEVVALTVQDPGGPLEPGDTLVAQYTATSTIGLWETRLVLLGPCAMTSIFGEALAGTVSRTVPIPIPAQCALGVPLSVGLSAEDAALQQRSRLTITGFTLSDLTPPTIGIQSVPPTGGSLIPDVAGTYFVEDTIRFRFGASDNHELRALVWEVQPAGFRDSLVVSGGGVDPWIDLPVLAGWVGPVELRFYARDASGLVSDTVATNPGAVRVLATTANPTIATAVTGEIRDVVMDERRGTLYLLQSSHSRIAVLETATLAATGTISTPAPAADFDLTPGGDSLLLTFPDLLALGVVDLRDATPSVTVVPLTSLDATLDQRPMGIRATANGRVFVRLGGSNPDGWTLLELDLASAIETMRTDAGVNGYVGPAGMERSHDYGTLVLLGADSQFQRYEAATDAFGARQTASYNSARPSVDRDGRHVAVSLDVYDGSLLPMLRVESMLPPGTSAYLISTLTPSGEYLYHARQPWGILRSRVGDGALLDRIRSSLHATLLRVSSDGAFLVEVENTNSPLSAIRLIELR
jgi:hypothetical protein